MKKNNRRNFFYFFFLFFLAVLISNAFVSALDSFGTFKRCSNIRITQVCSDATYITITSISYPNSSLLVSNKNMTFSDGEFYYNLNSSQTCELGRYDVRGISDGCEKSFAAYFEVTIDGKEKTLIKTDYQFFVFFGISMFLGLLLGAFGIFKDERILIFSAMGFFAAGILANYYQQETLLIFPTETISLILIGLGMLCLAIGIYRWLPED